MSSDWETIEETCIRASSGADLCAKLRFVLKRLTMLDGHTAAPFRRGDIIASMTMARVEGFLRNASEILKELIDAFFTGVVPLITVDGGRYTPETKEDSLKWLKVGSDIVALRKYVDTELDGYTESEVDEDDVDVKYFKSMVESIREKLDSVATEGVPDLIEQAHTAMKKHPKFRKAANAITKEKAGAGWLAATAVTKAD